MLAQIDTEGVNPAESAARFDAFVDELLKEEGVQR